MYGKKVLAVALSTEPSGKALCSGTPLPSLQALRRCSVNGWTLAARTHTDNGHLQAESAPTYFRQVRS
jgi:hypothetical protein